MNNAAGGSAPSADAPPPPPVRAAAQPPPPPEPAVAHEVPDDAPFPIENYGSGTGAEFRDELGKTFQEQMVEAFEDDDHLPSLNGVLVRMRPLYSQTPRHDARGDAMNIALEAMIIRVAPFWAGYQLARAFADHVKEKFHTDNIPFVEGEYEVIDNGSWYKDVATEFKKFAKQIIDRQVLIPESTSRDAHLWLQFAISYETEKGHRQKQEDRIMALPCLSLAMDDVFVARKDVGLFAIFDGHGGADCASYAVGHLPETFAAAMVETPQDIEKAVGVTLVNLDKRLTVRAEHERWKSGATAVVAALDKDTINVGWIGDSAAMIMNCLEVNRVTKAHSPTDEDEARRVREDGGELLYIQGELRVNGVLNVTRALGDLPGRPMISQKPDTVKIAREDSQYVLLIACDGVSDVFNDGEMFQLIEAFVHENPHTDFHKLGSYICEQAVENGSTDNVSCIAVYLRPPKDLWQLILSEPELNEEDLDDENYVEAQE